MVAYGSKLVLSRPKHRSVFDSGDEISGQVSERFRQAQKLLAETEQILDNETTPEHRTQWPNVYRLENATRHAQRVLRLADPGTTQLLAADELLASATQARDAIRAAVDSGGGDLIGSADRLLSANAQLEPQLSESDESAAEILSRLNGIQGEIENRKSQIDAQLGELAGTIDQQRGRLDQAIENNQKQFSEAQERRNEEHRQLLSDAEARTTELERQLKGEFDEAASGKQERAEETLNALQRELVKAQEITSFVGGTSTAAGYGKEADAQKKIADGLRGLAIFFGLLAAGLAVWAVIHAEQQSNPPLSVVLAKAVGSLVFAGLAGYVATQSGHHRLREEQARRRELDLLALPAFIATLPEEEKEEITGQVASKLFLSQATTSNGIPEAALNKESISLIGLLLDAIRKG
jgi:hypothetical protein